MTLQEKIESYIEEWDKKAPVSSLRLGNGYAYIPGADSEFFRQHYPIRFFFIDNLEYGESYTSDGKYLEEDKYPEITFGHYNDQIAIAKAIAEQNFDTDGV